MKPQRGLGGLDEPTTRALERATVAYDERFMIDLARFGGFPGPSANMTLAKVLAARVCATGRRDVDAFLVERGAPTGHAVGAEAFFFVTLGFLCQERIKKSIDVEASWATLDELAGDIRKPVRDAVVEILAGLAKHGLSDRIPSLTEGFLQASVALSVLSRRDILEVWSNDDDLITHLSACIDLAEHAGRADERSQGRRRLLEAIAEALPILAHRRPRVLDFCIERAKTEQPEIRTALEDCASRMKKTGMGKAGVMRFTAALDASQPARRDPLTYKGPTRGRARRADGRAERK